MWGIKADLHFPANASFSTRQMFALRYFFPSISRVGLGNPTSSAVSAAHTARLFSPIFPGAES